MIQNHSYHLGKGLDELCNTYENLIVMGDYNCVVAEDNMSEFCCIYIVSVA